MAHGVMFHHFYDARHPRGQGAISADNLRQLIGYLGREHILSAHEWMDRFAAGTLRTDDLCLTLDDTLLCQYDVALPVFEELGIEAFWFVYTAVIEGGVEMLEVYRKFRTVMYPDTVSFYCDFFDAIKRSAYAQLVSEYLQNFNPKEYLVDFGFYTDEDRRFRFIRDKVLGPSRYHEVMDSLLSIHEVDVTSFSADLWLKPSHLRTLESRGHIIGLHSHTHPTDLAALPVDSQREEYETNIRILSSILSQPPRTMSHPCNSYNEETLSVLKTLGIQLGFRANMKSIKYSPLEYPREDHSNIMARVRAVATHI